MFKLAETITFRSPLGTVAALERMAAAEGKRPSELARSILADRLKAAGFFSADAA